MFAGGVVNSCGNYKMPFNFKPKNKNLYCCFFVTYIKDKIRERVRPIMAARIMIFDISTLHPNTLLNLKPIKP